MKSTSEGKLLRIFIGENDKYQGRPLYQAVIEKAREMKLAGATAVKGFQGFGCKSHMHSANLLRLSEDLPIVIEMVDKEENIDRFLPVVDEMVPEGLVTVENVRVIFYRSGKCDQ